MSQCVPTVTLATRGLLAADLRSTSSMISGMQSVVCLNICPLMLLGPAMTSHCYVVQVALCVRARTNVSGYAKPLQARLVAFPSCYLYQSFMSCGHCSSHECSSMWRGEKKENQQNSWSRHLLQPVREVRLIKT